MTAERRWIPRAAAFAVLLAGCGRPEPQQPGTFTALLDGSVRGEYKGAAEFCLNPGGSASLSFLSQPDAAGFQLHTDTLKPGVHRVVDRAGLDRRERGGYAAQAYVPDSLLTDPYVRTGSIRIGRVDSLQVEGNFALTLAPRDSLHAVPPGRGGRLGVRVAFVARPRANCQAASESG